MEINITQFIKNENPMDYSASVVELGEDAGAITWQNALRASNDYMYVTCDEVRQELIDYFDGFGAWSLKTLEGMDAQVLNALLIQFVAGEYRNNPDDGRIYQDENENYFFYVGD